MKMRKEVKKLKPMKPQKEVKLGKSLEKRETKQGKLHI